MRKTIALTTLILSLTLTGTAYAAKAPTANPTQVINNQIDQLKDKIASRVSELNLVEKRGIIGTIADVTNNQITVNDTEGNSRYIDVDEITKFSSAASNSSFGLSDLKKGMQVSVLGIYNKESQRILARYIDTVTLPKRVSGEIAAIDSKNFQLTISTDDGKSANVEIDTTSTVNSYSNGGSLNKYGFSKLNVGDRVEVIGYPDKKDATLIITDRMIDFLDAPKNPNIAIATPTVAATTAPTSAGVKSIKPIK